MRHPLCVWPGCKAVGKPVKMPLTGEHSSLCDAHRPVRTLSHMRKLVAHG